MQLLVLIIGLYNGCEIIYSFVGFNFRIQLHTTLLQLAVQICGNICTANRPKFNILDCNMTKFASV